MRLQFSHYNYRDESCKRLSLVMLQARVVYIYITFRILTKIQLQANIQTDKKLN